MSAEEEDNNTITNIIKAKNMKGGKKDWLDLSVPKWVHLESFETNIKNMMENIENKIINKEEPNDTLYNKLLDMVEIKQPYAANVNKTKKYKIIKNKTKKIKIKK